LADIEQDVVSVMIQMARLHQCVTPSQAIQLIHGMIKGTDAQRKLISWKRKYSFGCSGDVGSQYWRNFKKHNADNICSKKARNTNLTGLAGLLLQTSRRYTLRYMNRWWKQRYRLSYLILSG